MEAGGKEKGERRHSKWKCSAVKQHIHQEQTSLKMLYVSSLLVLSAFRAWFMHFTVFDIHILSAGNWINANCLEQRCGMVLAFCIRIRRAFYSSHSGEMYVVKEKVKSQE